jgi:hypothetical protein
VRRIAPPSAVTVSGAPRPAEVLFHRGATFLPSPPPSPQGNGQIDLEFYRNLAGIDEHSLCHMVYYKVRRQNGGCQTAQACCGLTPSRHQDSAIARSEPCQALTISARRHSPTRLRITAFDPDRVKTRPTDKRFQILGEFWHILSARRLADRTKPLGIRSLTSPHGQLNSSPRRPRVSFPARRAPASGLTE